ncbi:hypothetical protein PS1_035996 [Malus domestica]
MEVAIEFPEEASFWDQTFLSKIPLYLPAHPLLRFSSADSLHLDHHHDTTLTHCRPGWSTGSSHFLPERALERQTLLYANVADQFGDASQKLIAWIGVNDRPLFPRAFVSEDLVNSERTWLAMRRVLWMRGSELRRWRVRKKRMGEEMGEEMREERRWWWWVLEKMVWVRVSAAEKDWGAGEREEMK